MKTTNNRLNAFSKILLFIAAGLLAYSVFVPIWRIELDAPQYPEGLMLQIYAYKIGGDVEIINGLNHYIGMKTLHTEDFIEFTVLPYMLFFFVAFTVFTALIARKKLFYGLLSSFVLFGVLSMVDFYRWNYNYGHNLDPNAAIKVPGMAYQPPLIGYKQLLNFGAYSIPDFGGWLIVGAGVLMLAVFCIAVNCFRRKSFNPNKSAKSLVLTSLAVVLLVACADFSPQAVHLNKDLCDHCKMTITDGRFAAELITEKGRVYKFDDITCMTAFGNQSKTPVKVFYIADYLHPKKMIDASKAIYIKGEQLKSPMRGNIAAFANQVEADKIAQKFNAKAITWDEVKKGE